jgi:nucleotide-binding universal stress UspA family protein
MKRVLVPVDGSECSLRAVDYLIAAYADGRRPEIHLLNVQYAMTGDVTQFVGRETVVGYQHEQSGDALRAARMRLDAAGIAYEVHEEAGHVADRIHHASMALGCDHIVMGTHGRGALAELLVGSTTLKVLHLTQLPVVLVK